MSREVDASGTFALALDGVTLAAVNATATEMDLAYGNHSMLSPHLDKVERYTALRQHVRAVGACLLLPDQDGDVLVRGLLRLAAAAASWAQHEESPRGERAVTPAQATADARRRLADAMRRLGELADAVEAGVESGPDLVYVQAVFGRGYDRLVTPALGRLSTDGSA